MPDVEGLSSSRTPASKRLESEILDLLECKRLEFANWLQFRVVELSECEKSWNPGLPGL